MDWKELATEVAKIGLPLIGAALPVPGGAAIGTALASHIGAKSADPSDILVALQSSADAVQKAKEFEATHQEKMLELTLANQTAEVQADVADRTSARDMVAKMKSMAPQILISIVYNLGYFWLLKYFIDNLHSQQMDEWQKGVIGTLVGVLTAAIPQINNFWFGSTHSSQKKDVLTALSQSSQE